MKQLLPNGTNHILAFTDKTNYGSFRKFLFNFRGLYVF